MLGAGDHVLVGLSGGPDSVCLLSIMSTLRSGLGITLSAVYVDHGLRPEETPAERAFCEMLCTSRGVPLTCRQTDVSASSLVRELGKQAAARELRYRTFEEEAFKSGAGRIALGHTKNDSAETLLINLLRGTGMSGLTGIPPVRGNVIRPLIEISRDEIMGYLEGISQPYVVDSSNLRTDYLRNRIRMEILPQLERINPAIVEALARTADILSEEDHYLDTAVTKTLMRLVSRKTPARIELFLSPMETTPLPLLRRILRRAFADLAGARTLTHEHVEEVIRLIRAGKSGTRVHLGRALRVIRSYATLIATTEEPKKVGEYTLNAGDRVLIKESGITIEASVRDEAGQADGRKAAVFDLDKISLPLTIRARRDGDFFYPSGFGKRVKVQDFFVNSKIPREERDSVPLVCSAERIVWVAGLRGDQRFLPDDDTRRYLVLTISAART